MTFREECIRKNLKLDEMAEALIVAALRCEAMDRQAEPDPVYSGPPRSCRVCGCTDNRACPGGCWWVGPDLCSACDAEVAEP